MMGSQPYFAPDQRNKPKSKNYTLPGWISLVTSLLKRLILRNRHSTLPNSTLLNQKPLTIMVFSCLTHIFTTLTTPTLKPNHTGLIHRAPLPTQHPSAFPPAPNEPTTAFAPSLVTGARWREFVKRVTGHGQKTPEDKEEEEGEGQVKGKESTSWVADSKSKTENGWEVGYKKATQMVVRRKGRGVFRFEKAMMEGTGVGLRDEDYGGIGSVDEGTGAEEEVKSRIEVLKDGFEYRVWTDDDVVVS
jgi:hypothetical protein